jgi:hypothetical protein
MHNVPQNCRGMLCSFGGMLCVRTWNGAFLEIHIPCTHFNLFCFQFCDGSEHPQTDHTLIDNMFVEDHSNSSH